MLKQIFYFFSAQEEDMFKMNVPGAEGMVCNFDITQQGAEKVTLHRFLMAAAATLF